MDRLLSMQAFVRVVDEQSFAAAARALDAAPTAVTRLVADLEAHLGVRLLHRSTRQLALTDAGEQYLSRVRTILADIEEAKAQAGRSASQPSGRVRVLMPPGFSFHQLAKHLPRFLDAYPEVAIDLANTGLIDMADAAYDVSILLAVGELTHGGFVAHRLATSHVVLCASPAYLARQGAPQSPTEMSAHRSLAVSVPGAPRSLSLFRDAANGGAGEAVEIHPPNTLAAQHADTLRRPSPASASPVCLRSCSKIRWPAAPSSGCCPIGTWPNSPSMRLCRPASTCRCGCALSPTS